MHCSHCGICCQKTEMELSEADIKRLEATGHKRQNFVRLDRAGIARLRNSGECCVFYEKTRRRCSVYVSRPIGCKIYPVLFSLRKGVIADKLCPLAGTVSEEDKRRVTERLVRLLHIIDGEAKSRKGLDSKVRSQAR